MDWSIVVAVISSLVAIGSWATSASKSRVDNLVQIIDAQEGRILTLEQDLKDAEIRIADLEEENRFYRHVIDEEGIDLCQYAVEEV